VLAPAWPGMDGDIQELRRDPLAVARLGVTEIVDHYDAIIRKLDRPPIIMGHSFGGLFTQILLDRGLGTAGVAIDSAPVKGMLLPVSRQMTSVMRSKVHRLVADLCATAPWRRACSSWSSWSMVSLRWRPIGPRARSGWTPPACQARDQRWALCREIAKSAGDHCRGQTLGEQAGGGQPAALQDRLVRAKPRLSRQGAAACAHAAILPGDP
jgi:pimeloyl-ACP methyl ester carboxylesterase